MSYILRSDAAKGYVRPMGALANATPARVSFLGLAAETRVRIYQVLFARTTVKASEWPKWMDRSIRSDAATYLLQSIKYDSAIFSVCRKIYEEARRTYIVSIELQITMPQWTRSLSILPANIRSGLLPSIQKVSFNDVNFAQGGVPAALLSQEAPNLRIVNIGRIAFATTLSLWQFYDAFINGVRDWSSSHKHCSYNRFLINQGLDICGLSETKRRARRTWHGQWLQHLVDDKSRKYAVLGTICNSAKVTHLTYLETVSSKPLKVTCRARTNSHRFWKLT